MKPFRTLISPLPNFFSGFLFLVVVSLELTNATSHRDMKDSDWPLIFQAVRKARKRLNWPVVIVTLLKVGIILFCVTLFVVVVASR